MTRVFLLPIAAACALLCVLGFACPVLGEDEILPVQIKSYEKNFVVISSDSAAASWVAAEAEKIRRQILNEFQWKQKWGKPLVLRLGQIEESRTRADLRRLIARKIFHHLPFWLQEGLERYFSGRRDFHPDRLKEVQTGGRWLNLPALLKQDHPFPETVWQDVFQKEAACLVFFLKVCHPDILTAYRKGKGDFRALMGLEEEWLRWIVQSNVLLFWQGSQPGLAPADFRRAFARCLRVKVRDETGKLLRADSAMNLSSLESCCKQDIARRKLLASYPELVKLARMGPENALQVQDYADCAGNILAGKEFYETFERLEKRRLENTAHQR